MHEARINQASAALLAGDHAAAAQTLEQAVASRPGDANALFLLAQCRFFLGDAEGCLEMGRALASRAPNNPWGEMAIGAALLLAEKRAEAEPHLAAARRLAGHNAAVHIRLGAITLHLSEPADAARHYAEALALAPRDPDAQAGMGLAFLASGDAAGAETRLRASLAERFHAPALHNQLGLLFTEQGRWEEAARSLRTAAAQYGGLARVRALLERVEGAKRG